MKTLQLIHFQAIDKARSEMTQRAQACCGGFGEHREDKVLQLENRGTAFRH